MALNKNTLADAMKIAATPKEYDTPPSENQAKLDSDEAIEKMAEAIVNHIVNNLDIDVPAQKFVDTVTGGSGAPAIGIKNITKVGCTVK